jgi:hypothetical protein
MTTARRKCVLGLAMLAALAAGCGDGRPTRVPISGRVLIDDQPLTRGFVRFFPTQGRAATGEVQPDGSFTLWCYDPVNKDGCLLGNHLVSVTAIESVNDTTQKWHVPKEYGDHRTSGLKETVDGPDSNRVIKLTWADKKPVIETFANEGGPPPK